MNGLTRRQMIGKVLHGCAACTAVAGIGRAAGAAESGAGERPPLGQADFPITRNARDAEAMFRQGFNCAQAVLSCCGRRFGLPQETGKRMGAAFVGGMGMMGLTCGAVTGAFMAIGLKHAQIDLSDKESADKASRLVREFTKRFTRLHGSICCNELLGVDIGTDAGVRQATEDGSFASRCPVYVRDCAALFEHLLASGD